MLLIRWSNSVADLCSEVELDPCVESNVFIGAEEEPTCVNVTFRVVLAAILRVSRRASRYHSRCSSGSDGGGP